MIAVIVLAITTTAMAVVSCKKDNQNTLNQKGYTIQQAADYRQIEDISSYLKDFKKKMAESKGNEAYNLDDAAWHLASLANSEFCEVNVEYNDVQFDTIEMQVNILDGIVLLGDLNTAYEQMCTEIQQFKEGFTHNNQNLYYINVSISNDGTAKIALMTSFNTNSKYQWDHTWYYGSEYDAICAFYQYFSVDSIFQWNTTAANELTRFLNLIEHHENDSSDINHPHLYYTPTRNHTFDYTNSIDIYHSFFYNDSRVFAKRTSSSSLDYVLSFDEMVYCLDSYPGLAYDYINTFYPIENPVCWKVTPNSKYHNFYYHYHILTVDYGHLYSENPIGDL